MSKPMVFVSSVVSGMEKTRSVVQDLIGKDLGYDVVASECEGSKTRTPMAQCRKWARECDIYIGILGERCGWVVPRLGISVTEVEFNEARQDNPEKILVYVSAGRKEPRQEAFVRRIENFTEGYFRRKPFSNEAELIEGMRDDLARFVKERLDVIKTKKLKVRPITTPSAAEYVVADLDERARRMRSDVIQVVKELGFTPVDLFGSQGWQVYCSTLRTVSSSSLFIGKRKVGDHSDVLFSIWVLPEKLNVDSFRAYSQIFERYIYRSQQYHEHPARFTILLVHGAATLRVLENIGRMWSRTCFKVAPGLYFGTSLDTKPGQETDAFHENMLFLSGVTNKEIMLSKLVDTLEWLGKEANRVNFRCNYIKPYKVIERGKS